MRIKTLLTAVLAVAATALLAATVPFASGATSKAAHSAAAVRVSTKTVPGLGRILVNGSGRTLYMFVPDKDKKVTCVSTCAKIWPPLFGSKAVASGGAKQSLVGSDKDPAGGRVITYKGWPLYLYLGDTKSGVAFGQALNMNGGLWYVLAPSGALIKHKPTKGGGSGGGGGGGSTTTTTTTTTSTSTTAPGGPSQCDDSDNDGDQNAGGPDDGDGCL
jgi:predicted lipoprotein with Yx(FWY)xxD motif